MPHYPENIIEEVRSANDIVDVISGYVSLKRKGGTLFGLCPFHNEKSPSFSVSPGKQLYYCFGCGAGGNVITFLMQYENFTFAEAVQSLAERAGITLPVQEYGAKQREEADKRQRLLEIQKEAAKYFYLLLRSGRGKKAFDYFKKRELSDETMKRFGLGCSDSYSDSLYRYLRAKGYDDEILKESGLIHMDAKRGGHDKFWNRAMFPIMDIHNKVIGFGGRVMGEGEPKYLNSPETMIFDKSRNLYGLNIARATKRPYLILCEGYMDVISLHQAGFDNAVASLGTSLTVGHAGLISRYTKEVRLSYDSDGAGVKAALRAIPILKEAGISVKVIDMKPYKDPDEFIKALGADAYEERLQRAENGFLFEIGVLERQYDMSSPDGKTGFYNETAKKLCGFTEKLERDNYIEAVAGRYQIASDDLRKLVNRYGMMAIHTEKKRSAYRREDDGDAGSESGRESRTGRQKKEDGGKKSEKLLLTWAVQEKSLFETIKKYVTPEDFLDELCYKVAMTLFGQYETDGQANPAKIVSSFTDGELQNEVAGMFNATIPLPETEEERERAVRETILKVKKGGLEKRSKNLAPDDMQGLIHLVEEKRSLEELERIWSK